MRYLVEYFDNQQRFRTTEVDAIDERHIPFALRKIGRKVNKVSKAKVIGESISERQTELALATQ